MKIALLIHDDRQASGQYDRPEPFFGTAPTALLQGLATLSEVEVHVVACIRQRVAAPEKIGPNIFFHSVVVPQNGWMRTFYQGCIRAARRKLREIAPDIVHGQGTELDCALDAAFSGFPSVLTVHGNMRAVARASGARPFSFYWLAARLENFVLPRADGVVCITDYTRAAVAARARKTWVVPNAVDAAFFEIARSPAAAPVGLCVGTVCNYKNQNALIRALDPLAAEKKFKLVFAGGVKAGDYGREFLELIRTRPWCEHLGFIGREELKARLRSAAFLALPTLEDNCPMVVLEAMAAGVPVFASAIGGVPDLIEHNVTGLLCDPQQPESFRAAAARLLNEVGWAEKLAATARAAAKEKFQPQVIARRHLEIYREVLGRK